MYGHQCFAFAGTLSSRQDVVYKWRVDNKMDVYSRVPVMTTVFEEATPHRVQLIAYNLGLSFGVYSEILRRFSTAVVNVPLPIVHSGDNNNIINVLFHDKP